MEVEIRNWEMGVKCVKDGDVGWTPVMGRKRKKSARSEESKSSGNLNVNNKSLVRYMKMDGIPEEFISRKFENFEMGGSETQPFASRTRTKIKVKLVVSCMIEYM